MSVSGIFARVVALIGAVAIRLRHRRDGLQEPAYGSTPTIPTAKPQGIPTLKMPTARGWTARANANRRGRAQSERIRNRPQTSTLDPRIAEWRRARGRGT